VPAAAEALPAAAAQGQVFGEQGGKGSEAEQGKRAEGGDR